MIDLRLATRRSPLALAQALLAAQALERVGATSTFVEVATTGDRDRISSVTTLTEVGAFVRSVQAAVIDGDADVAVHSGKDLPVAGPEGLVPFYLPRAEPWDVLCGSSLDRLGPGSVVGSGSPRREAQLKLLLPDVEVVDVRGNIDTRLAMVTEGNMAALILAEAGLSRLGRQDSISHRFALAQMVPAPAQAAITLETMAGSRAAEMLALVDHAPTRRAVEAERGLLEATGAGCRSALGALAGIRPDGSLEMTCFVNDARGSRWSHAVGSDRDDVVTAGRRELGI
ncbi:hydroxymethylbilane synthase [soil metagenome]